MPKRWHQAHDGVHKYGFGRLQPLTQFRSVKRYRVHVRNELELLPWLEVLHHPATQKFKLPWLTHLSFLTTQKIKVIQERRFFFKRVGTRSLEHPELEFEKAHTQSSWLRVVWVTFLSLLTGIKTRETRDQRRRNARKYLDVHCSVLPFDAALQLIRLYQGRQFQDFLLLSVLFHKTFC
jgi:hypothetical protein